MFFHRGLIILFFLPQVTLNSILLYSIPKIPLFLRNFLNLSNPPINQTRLVDCVSLSQNK
ncbi:hypothetical protein Lalb_Chr22g0354161 [Lupinus albus]|uniref:Uncharacterized protein n=1 Tax=Lupinus albus TaxID=3870 RepID=A0A6A4N0J7_LUPAL|nr:hypothetical protein Lalb_Chr22g0354161 [Lupinus albus]